MATDSVKKIFLFQIEKNNGDRNKIVSFLDTILFTQTKRKRNKNLKTPTSRTTLAYLKFSQCKFQKCFRIMKKVIMVHVCVCVWYYHDDDTMVPKGIVFRITTPYSNQYPTAWERHMGFKWNDYDDCDRLFYKLMTAIRLGLDFVLVE